MLNLEYVRSAAMDFVTVFFAYCIAAHLVGATLPKLVAIALSTFYSLFLLGPAAGMLGGMDKAIELQKAGYLAFPNNVYFDEPGNPIFLVLFVLTTPILAWLASLVYMHVFVRGSLNGRDV